MPGIYTNDIIIMVVMHTHFKHYRRVELLGVGLYLGLGNIPIF